MNHYYVSTIFLPIIIVPVIASTRESDVIILSDEKLIEYKTVKDLRNKEKIFHRKRTYTAADILVTKAYTAS